MKKHTHKNFTSGQTIKELQNSKNWSMRRIRMKGFYESLGFTDRSTMSPLISDYIRLCRKARIFDEKKEFDHWAQLITGNENLKFENYDERKFFSCTEEIERLVVRKFGDEYNEFFDCWVECDSKFGDTNFDSASMSRCMKNCFKTFNGQLDSVRHATIAYISNTEIMDMKTIFVDNRAKKMTDFDKDP